MPRIAFDGGADYPSDGSILQVGRSGGSQTSNPDGALVPAVRPLDAGSQPVAGGFNFALQFALEYRTAQPGVTLVLVPCNDGGTGFSNGRWNPGNGLYEDMLSRTNSVLAANPSFLLKGLLWNQGEKDAENAMTGAAYEAAFDAMIADFRNRTGHPTLPVVTAQMYPDFTTGTAAAINAVLSDTPNRLVYTGFASTNGLSTSDGLHGNAASARTLGTRYYNAYLAALANVPGPAAAPSLVLSPGDGQISVALSEGASGGAVATGYTYERRQSGTGTWITLSSGTTVSPFVDTGLTNGTSYEYRASVTNAHGTSPYSAIVSAAPEAPPAEVLVLGVDHDYKGSGGTAFTFTGLSTVAGTAVVAVMTTGGLDSPQATSVIVGGTAAVRIGAVTTGNNAMVDFWRVDVSATTVDVDVTIDPGSDANVPRCALTIWSLTAGAVAGDHAGSTGYNGTSDAVTLDVAAGGVILAAHMSRGTNTLTDYAFAGPGTSSVADVSIKPSNNVTYSAASQAYVGVELGETVTASRSGTATGGAVAAIALNPS